MQQLFLIMLVASSFTFLGCQKSKSIAYKKIEPAQIDPIQGSEISKLTLTEKAAERIGIKTSPVSEVTGINSATTIRSVIPYSSVLYDTDGKTWVYTNPGPLVFVRHEISIAFIEGMKAFLSEGPAISVSVVTQGAAELLGTEYHVGH